MAHLANTHDFLSIELSFHCRSLPKLDRMSNTDAFCVVYLTTPPPPQPQGQQNGGLNQQMGLLNFNNGVNGSTNNSNNCLEICRTEVNYDTANPDFVMSTKVDYHFEEHQLLTIKVYDEDKKGSKDLRDHEYIGCASCSLGELMGSNANSLSFKLKGPKATKEATVAVRAEEVSTCSDQLILGLSAAKLKNKDGFFGKSDPFIRMSRINEDGSWELVWQSETVMDNLSPVFKPQQIQVQKIW